MRVALIYPPITDPTSGYHSLSYLDSYAAEQGFTDIDIIDSNIEAFHDTLRPENVNEILAWARLRRAEIDHAADLTPQDRDELHTLWTAQALDPDELFEAVDILRDEEVFYDYASYRWAVERVVNWMNLLGTQGIPGQFGDGFSLSSTAINVSSVAELTDKAKLARLCRPFGNYFDNVLPRRLAEGGYTVVGINVTYRRQLPFALHLAAQVRATLPDAFIVFGGTEVSDVWKYLADKSSFFDIFDGDCCVVGEGESAFVEILRALENGALPEPTANIRLHPRFGRRASLLKLHYENTKAIPTPRYDKLPWHLYLSPHRFVYYSPSRGCYWNKCTFCDYGLNSDGPTSPWRQDPAEKTVHDLLAIASFSKFVYFSVDVLAPATILKFAEGIVAAGIDIRWSAEIRLEKYWSPERCELLRRSGCVAVSVGFESGNQRILDLIDKGTSPGRVLVTTRNMHNAGIGVEMMGFTGFPTETLEEAMDSVRFLQDHRSLWTLGGLDGFELTPMAIVAKRPADFGITNVRPRPGDDIHRSLLYEDPTGHGPSNFRLYHTGRALLQPEHFDRPWLGGVDTPHTIFYHDRYGVKILEEITNALQRQARSWRGPWRLNGTLTPSPPPGCQPDGQSGESSSDQWFVRADGTSHQISAAEATALRLIADRVEAPDDDDPVWMSLVENHFVTPALTRREIVRGTRPQNLTSSSLASGAV